MESVRLGQADKASSELNYVGSHLISCCVLAIQFLFGCDTPFYRPLDSNIKFIREIRPMVNRTPVMEHQHVAGVIDFPDNSGPWKP